MMLTKIRKNNRSKTEKQMEGKMGMKNPFLLKCTFLYVLYFFLYLFLYLFSYVLVLAVFHLHCSRIHCHHHFSVAPGSLHQAEGGQQGTGHETA